MIDTVEVFEDSQLTFENVSKVCDFPSNATHVRFSDKISQGLKYIDDSVKVIISTDGANYSKELIENKNFTVKFDLINNTLYVDILKNIIEILKNINNILYIKVIFKVEIINVNLLDSILKNTGIFTIVKIDDTGVIPLSEDTKVQLKYTTAQKYDIEVSGYALNTCTNNSILDAKFCFNTLKNSNYINSQYILKIKPTNHLLFPKNLGKNIKAYTSYCRYIDDKIIDIPPERIHCKLNDDGDLEISIDYISKDKQNIKSTDREYICVVIPYTVINKANYNLESIYGSILVKKLGSDTILASLDSLCLCINFQDCKEESDFIY